MALTQITSGACGHRRRGNVASRSAGLGGPSGIGEASAPGITHNRRAKLVLTSGADGLERRPPTSGAEERRGGLHAELQPGSVWYASFRRSTLQATTFFSQPGFELRKHWDVQGLQQGRHASWHVDEVHVGCPRGAVHSRAQVTWRTIEEQDGLRVLVLEHFGQRGQQPSHNAVLVPGSLFSKKVHCLRPVARNGLKQRPCELPLGTDDELRQQRLQTRIVADERYVSDRASQAGLGDFWAQTFGISGNCLLADRCAATTFKESGQTGLVQVDQQWALGT